MPEGVQIPLDNGWGPNLRNCTRLLGCVPKHMDCMLHAASSAAMNSVLARNAGSSKVHHVK